MKDLEKSQKELLVKRLDEIAETSSNLEVGKERLLIIEKLCNYLDDHDILYAVVKELLRAGPIFGRFYDRIIAQFNSLDVLVGYIQTQKDAAFDNWKRDSIVLLNAIEANDNDGLFIENGVLKRVFKDKERIVLPIGVHTIAGKAFCCDHLILVKQIVIPNTIKYIYPAYCLVDNNIEILYQGSEEDWNSITYETFSENDVDWEGKLKVRFALT